MHPLIKLQSALKENEAILIDSNDYHLSEYLSDHFKLREYYSSFNGSYGVLVIDKFNAYLWTDGRYYIQARKQINQYITLMLPNNTNYKQYLDFLCSYDKVYFDGRITKSSDGIFLKEKGINIDSNYKFDDNLEPIFFTKPFILGNEYCGFNYNYKINKIRQLIKENGANLHILSKLDDIAWILNLRGNDIPYNPVNFAFLIIDLDNTYLFISDEKKTITNNYQDITILNYDDIYSFINNISNKKILIDINSVNYSLYNSINNANIIINKKNPSLMLKAIKNDIEINNIKKCHIKDGVAVTKFMYYLKNNYKNLTEYDAQLYLDNLRSQIDDYIELSFNTISAYNSNAAMAHYQASKDNPVKLGAGLLLVDSGGHYYSGTTDITRTFILGEISPSWKDYYTLVLKGMINLSKARFLYGCRGESLDVLARIPLWNKYLEYEHGTGHGIGYLLNVHEGPNAFRWRFSNNNCIIEPNMVTSCEPGIYIENELGIRIENEMVSKIDIKNNYGTFLSFDTLTYVPIDIDGINISLLNNDEIDFLNNYHQKVYELISPYLNDEEKIFLKNYTRKI